MKMLSASKSGLARAVISAALGATFAAQVSADGASMTPDQLSRYMEPYVAEVNKVLPRMRGEGLRQEKVLARPGGVLVMNYTVLYPVSHEMLTHINSQGRTDAVQSLCGSTRVRSLLEAGAVIRYALYSSAGSRLTSIDVKREHCR